jgi:hypothetical protein
MGQMTFRYRKPLRKEGETSKYMKAIKVIAILAVAAAALGLGACASQPAPPPPAPVTRTK